MERELLLVRFNNYISTKALEGYNIVDRNDAFFTAVLFKPGEKVNHLLHAILTIVTCVWGIVWIILASKARSDERIRISFDSNGNLVEERIKS